MKTSWLLQKQVEQLLADGGQSPFLFSARQTNLHVDKKNRAAESSHQSRPPKVY